MADFNNIIPAILENEGGYVHDASDGGGETYCGISRKNWPKWMGWNIIDQHRHLKTGDIINDAALAALVRSFYKINFWDKIRGDEIKDDGVAQTIFDFAVNAGISQAIFLVQQTLGIAQRGAMDDFTLQTLNAQTGFSL